MKKIGISGRIADFFLTSKLTPLIAITAVLLGIAAITITPREEEPQISVPMVDIFIPFPGASAKEIESLVARPAERVLSEINGVEYTYSMSKPGMALITVRFFVGEDENDSVVKVYDKLESNKDWIPPEVGVLAPIVRPTGINDVPIVSLTLWSKTFTGYELLRTAHNLEEELQKIEGTGKIHTIGGTRRAINVYLDPGRMTGHNVTPLEIYKKLGDANFSMPSGKFLSQNKVISVETGEFLKDVDDVKKLVVGLNQGKPVYLVDVAEVVDGAEEPDTYVWLTPGPAAEKKGIQGDMPYPAVTITIAKKEGQNAVSIADAVLEKIENLKGFMIPQEINVTVTRNYGETANHKANELLEHLLIATVAVVFFIAVTLGRSAGTVVAVVIPITILLTLFSSYFIGFTINRVSLFALIFSIGILVDDAIVVVENMYRRKKINKGLSLRECAVRAVDEVGNPTILATFTVIAALLPMAFVTGLMGPYMGPIPINASSAMFFSLLVAFIITPWLTYWMMKREKKGKENAHDDSVFESRVEKFYRWFLTPLFQDLKRRKKFFGIILGLFVFSLSLTYFKAVVLKMLPFDNKSEVMVVIDLPESSSLENTAYVASQLGDVIKGFDEVTDFETYIGTASPMNFNGLVRHYYIKKGDNIAEIQVNLVDKSERDEQSHGFAQRLREKLLPISIDLKANVKVIEVPPGPPVLSPLVAEVYGPDREDRAELTKMIRGVFENTEGIIETDDMLEEERDKITLVVDKEKATLKGVSTKDVVDTVHFSLQGRDITALHRPGEKYYLPIKLRFPQSMRDQLPKILDTKIRSESGRLIALNELVDVENVPEEITIFHKNLRPVDYILADAAGEEDSPLYGLYKVWEKVKEMKVGGGNIEQYFINQPSNPDEYAIKWDGEFQITYETFRDMGIAYAAGLVLIYLLVVGQFRSFMIPLIIMAPIPLTLIGIFPGHWIMGAQFTATSMIGAIALAGIIVRNSILLVDFTLNELKEGIPLEEAVIKGGAARLRPIVLTASAAMVGAFVIIFDPIFQGLAISLLFGVFVSTLLTLVVIPLIFYIYFQKEARRTAYLKEIQ